eukprot:11224341-Lingulodinium_polyedra.AAC.1
MAAGVCRDLRIWPQVFEASWRPVIIGAFPGSVRSAKLGSACTLCAAVTEDIRAVSIRCIGCNGN